MNRRGFITALLAFIAARFMPKVSPPPIPPPLPIIPMMVSSRAVPGRIDFISLKQWYRIEMKDSDFYEPFRQPVFSSDGQSVKAYFKAQLQLHHETPPSA